jgi:hypothetical protein
VLPLISLYELYQLKQFVYRRSNDSISLQKMIANSDLSLLNRYRILSWGPKKGLLMSGGRKSWRVRESVVVMMPQEYKEQ